MTRTILSVVAVGLIGAIALIGMWIVAPKTGDRPALAATKPAQPRLPQRIITVAPSATEIVFALGAGDRVVGVSAFAMYPPEALKRPKVGGPLDADLEQVLALRPDLVIVQGEQPTIHQLCQDNHIPIMHHRGEDLESAYRNIMEIGKEIGKTVEAAVMVSDIRAQIAKVAAATKSHPRQKVFISSNRNIDQPMGQIYTFGKGQFVTELIEVAGGQNIFANLDAAYPQISLEEIIGRQPDVIIELMPDEPGRPAAAAKALRQWEEFGTLAAVKNHRLCVLTEDYLLYPGPRVGQLARLLASKIHPEVRFD